MSRRRRGKKPRVFRQAGQLTVVAEKRRMWRIPSWILTPVLVLLGLLAMPLLPCFVAFGDYSDNKNEVEDGFSVVLVAVVFIMLMAVLITGRSLVGVLLSGELCWQGSRYGGVHCYTFHENAGQFVMLFAFCWIMLWLCLTMLIGAVRFLMSSDNQDT